MIGTLNLYCDESGHLENDTEQPYMILGYISVGSHEIKDYKVKINEIKEKHNFYSEIKWVNVSQSKLNFYLDLVNFFFDSELKFRALVVTEDDVKNQALGQDFDSFYYKMYYQLIHHQVDMLYKYNIYLDIKDTLSSRKVNKLKSILQSKYGVINNLQNIRSHESLFLQIADLFMGAISYNLRGLNKVTAKVDIINLIKERSNKTLMRSTSKYEPKLNLFFIDL